MTAAVSCLNASPSLLIIGVPMATILAFIAGLTEMVPIVGLWIGGVIAIIVTLALAPEKASLIFRPAIANLTCG